MVEANITINQPEKRQQATKAQRLASMLFLQTTHMKQYWSVLIWLSVLWLGCNKSEENGLGFDVLLERQFSIQPGIGPLVVHHFYLENVPTNFQQYLHQAGKQPEDITKVLTSRASLDAIYDEHKLDFIDRISIRLYDERTPNDYIEIAYRDPAPLDPGSSMGLIPSLADSKRMIELDRVSIDVAMELRKTTPDEIPVKLSLLLRANYE